MSILRGLAALILITLLSSSLHAEFLYKDEVVNNPVFTKQIETIGAELKAKTGVSEHAAPYHVSRAAWLLHSSHVGIHNSAGFPAQLAAESAHDRAHVLLGRRQRYADIRSVCGCRTLDRCWALRA